MTKTITFRKKLILALAILSLAANVLPSFAAYGVQTKTSQCVANQALPDSNCTPGAVLTTNTNTVCKVGYTKTVRDVPLSKSKQVFTEYGIPYSLHSRYEVDHLISLELGGSNDISNLWPEPSSITNGSLVKDKFENYLHAQVCAGKVSLSEAQAEISSNWLQYYSATTTTAVKTTPKPQTTAKPVNVPIVPTPVPTLVTPPPAQQTKVSVPAGATALCRDGSYSYSQTHRGTCSHHGGVAKWY